MSNFLFVFGDKNGEMNCSKWNALYPANAINQLNNGHQALTMHIDQFAQNNDDTKKILMMADMIIVERNLFGDALTSIMFYKVRNKTIIAIFDDAYNYMHPENVSYQFWHDGQIKYYDEESKQEKVGTMQPHPMDQFKWGMRMVKGIQLPSPYLAKDWDEYNKTYYIPNYIEFERYIDVKPLYPHPKKDIIIGWGGSMSHVASFRNSNVLGALKSVCKKYNNVKIMITGDKRVFDLLDVGKTRKIYNPFVEEEKFLSLMKTFDIALAPLDGDYDRRRSRVKVLEYMALKMPWVASDYPPYEGFKEFGLFANNTKESWEEKLFYMIDNIDERREYAKGIPYEYAKTQSYANNIQNTINIYQKIINEKYLT